jgi:hypothetical protein
VASRGASRQNDSRTSKEELERWMTELSNGALGQRRRAWRRQPDPPAKRKQALALAKTGETVSLSHDPISEKAVDANDPFEHNLSIIQQSGIAVEKQEVSFHGSTFTHSSSLLSCVARRQAVITAICSPTS